MNHRTREILAAIKLRQNDEKAIRAKKSQRIAAALHMRHGQRRKA